jgi:hypothetical protein
LLNGLELPAVQPERCGTQALRASAGDAGDFVFELDFRAAKQLPGYGLEYGMVQRWSYVAKS